MKHGRVPLLKTPSVSTIDTVEYVQYPRTKNATYEKKSVAVTYNPQNYYLFDMISMGHKFCKLKTGFTGSQKADSARADKPSNFDFLQLMLNAHSI